MAPRHGYIGGGAIRSGKEARVAARGARMRATGATARTSARAPSAPRARHTSREVVRAAEVVHDAVPGRTRFRHPTLLGDAARIERVVAGVRSLPGVRTVKASAITGTVLVTFAVPASGEALARAIGTLAAGKSARGPRAAVAIPEAGSSDAAPAAVSLPRAGRAAPSPPAVRAVPPSPVSAPPASGPAWHAMPVAEVVRRLRTDPRRGLDENECGTRRREHGPNELGRTEPRSGWSIFAEQISSLPMALLGASAGLSLVTGGIADAIVIGGVVLANAGIATRTEKQAERTILGLSQYDPHPVRVLRAGRRLEVLPADLVPGDVIELEPGTLVAADARLVSVDDLTVNESSLTGEALPVHKSATARLRPDLGIGDRITMVFRGTAVTGGRGVAVVTATGAHTEIGRIQHLLGAVRPPETPIQRQLGEIEKELVIVNGLICAGVFGLGLLRGEGWLPMLRTAISLAVAAIPEGLPTVATTTLAFGIQDMRRRNVLVRKLDAVETLGAVEVVGLDKTGTLTENRMAVVAAHVDGNLHAMDGAHLAPASPGAGGDAADVARRMFEVAALCSDAMLAPAGREREVLGTPTEAALVHAALALGVDVAGLRRAQPVAATVQRTLARKRMSTLHALAGGRRRLCLKGDPVEVLERCTRVLTADGERPLDAAARREVLKANQRMAGQALRVLGMAVRESGGDPRDERELTWLGLAGLANPVRRGALPAIKVLHGAGIRTVMITGDQSATAFAIARELDLADGDEVRVLEAGQIKGVDKDELAAIAANPHVFARVSPVDKLEIVRALQAGGRIVAMTGDGINDGPALKAADIGVAMGGAGTDVAREVADIVLATDELDGIIEAVRLGRATYANIRKVLRFLVGTNAAETLVMLGASIAGWPEPLHPMQLLWLNLVTDVLPGLALGLEPPEPDVLDDPPHDPRAPILAPADFRRLLAEGTVIGGAALAVFLLEGGLRDPRHVGPAPPPSRASTVAFHTLTMAQLTHAIACRSEHHGVLEELRRPPNGKLYAALAACTALQVGAQVVPFTRRLLGLTPLRAADLGAIALALLGTVTANEAVGAVLRRRAARAHVARAEGHAAPSRSSP